MTVVILDSSYGCGSEHDVGASLDGSRWIRNILGTHRRTPNAHMASMPSVSNALSHFRGMPCSGPHVRCEGISESVKFSSAGGHLEISGVHNYRRELRNVNTKGPENELGPRKVKQKRRLLATGTTSLLR